MNQLIQSSSIKTMKVKSKFSGHETTPAQYLAEVMCMRQASKKQIPLPSKFWNTPAWRVIYKQQLLAAHSLLKVYKPESIIRAIERKEVSWVFSLRFKGLIQIILEEEAKIDKKIEQIEKINVPVIVEETLQPQKPFGRNSRMSKLDE